MSQHTDEMNDFFRDHFWGVLLTIILTVGSGYFSFRITMSAFQERVSNVQAKVDEIEGDIEKLQNRRENLRIDVTRIELKVNALLRSRGIDPNNLSNAERDPANEQ